MSSTDAIKSQIQPSSAPPSAIIPASDSGPRSEDEKGSAHQSTSGGDDSIDVVNYKQGVDVAVDFVAGAHGEDVLDAEAVTRLRRKLDWHLLPLIFAVYASESDYHWRLASPYRSRSTKLLPI